MIRANTFKLPEKGEYLVGQNCIAKCLQTFQNKETVMCTLQNLHKKDFIRDIPDWYFQDDKHSWKVIKDSTLARLLYD